MQSLTEVIEELGNPFLEDSEDLLVDSRNIVDTALSDTFKDIEQLGLDQYETYVEERLVKQTKAIADPIKRNNLHLFSLAPCTHEEADTRILLHLEDSVKQQYNKALIRTVDTDVVVLAILSA